MSETAPRPTKVARSLRIDAVRGTAALMVMLYHAWLLGTPSGTGSLDPGIWLSTTLMRHGWVGVPVFFVLSGFLLTRLALPVAHFDARAFLFRRTRRILPGYGVQWMVFGVAVLAGLSIPGMRTTPSGLDSLVQPLMLYNLWPGAPRPWLDVWWSLPVEMAFYLLFPMLLTQLRAGRRWVLVCLLAIAPVVRYLPGMLWPESRWPFTLTAHLPGHLDMFLIGMLAATLYSRNESAPGLLARMLRHGATPYLIPAVLLALICLPAWMQLPSPRFTVTHPLWALWNSLFAAAVAALLCAMTRRDTLQNPVSWPIGQLARVGTVSYGLYLWHLPVVASLAAWASGLSAHPLRALLLFLAALPCSLLLAWLSWHLVERRWLRTAAS